ncbi:hypothetical protein EUTSA_v10009324mg [Eutrema salsugineum]|uniref:Berberine/berberine-like domain-containing protein n=1 Tax=Eutrema salsugineum TaxID=72664 RepID=V4MNY5_EUTSA|nr:hypothetical protein EUTSA_v10009324mg [Eutrema salsugineum]
MTTMAPGEFSGGTNPIKRKSDYVQKPIFNSGLASIFKILIENENVMSEITAIKTVFPHRAGKIFKINIRGNEPLRVEKFKRGVLNYGDVDIGKNLNSTYEEGKVYRVKYFKNNFERLVQVKTTVDPDNSSALRPLDYL